MQQEPGETYQVELAPVGTAIHMGADMIMSIIANECALATESAEARLHQLGRYLEGYKKWSQTNLATESAKLESAHKNIHELEQRYLELQNRRRSDELVLQNLSGQIQALQQERTYLHAELSASLNNQRMAVPAMAPEEPCPVDLISDLAKYDILYCGQNSLSFGEQWLQLWNQYVSDDAQDPGLSMNDRITPKELGILLENFSSQVRRDRETIQTQQETISSLQKERAYLFELCNKDSKPQAYPVPVEADLHIPISQFSKPFAFPESQGFEDPHLSTVKSEPSIEFLNHPTPLCGPIDHTCAQPS